VELPLEAEGDGDDVASARELWGDERLIAIVCAGNEACTLVMNGFVDCNLGSLGSVVELSTAIIGVCVKEVEVTGVGAVGGGDGN